MLKGRFYMIQPTGFLPQFKNLNKGRVYINLILNSVNLFPYCDGLLYFSGE